MLFSVIVPVYNVAKYLPACVDSLVCQDCDDWELILVDDGATDGICPGLCDDYAARFPGLIRVVHQPNGGLGAARNTGLELAKGEYVLFVDSDDTVAPDTLFRLREEIRRLPADMYVFSFRYVSEDGEEKPAEPRKVQPNDSAITLSDAPELLLEPPMAWCRLCRRDLYLDHQIRFPGRVWFEDLSTTPGLLLHAKSIVLLDDPFYGYLLREGSIMRSANLKRNLEILGALDMAAAPFEQSGTEKDYEPWLTFLAVDSILAAARRVLTADPGADYLDDFLSGLRQRYPRYRDCPLLPGLGRKKAILLKLLEHRQYRVAAAMFRLAGAIKKK